MVFRLGSIPVHVSGRFFLIALFLGAGYRTPDKLAIWAAVVFVSVLVHELGHALVGRAFGLAPRIDLHGMGGTTSWDAGGRNVGNARSIAISLAGPFAGFLFGGAVYVATRLGVDPKHPLGAFAILQLLSVNIGWGIVNLLPMLPLDGGNVMRAALNGITKGRGEKAARVVSIGVAGVALIYAAMTQWLWLGFLAVLFIVSNVQSLRQLDQRMVDAPLAQAMEKAYAALETHDGKTATALLRPVLVANASAELRQMALRLFSYALLLEGEWAELMPLLESERAVLGQEELSRYAQAAREMGRTAEATQIDAIRSAS